MGGGFVDSVIPELDKLMVGDAAPLGGDERAARARRMLALLPHIENVRPILTEDDYLAAMTVKSALASLYCFAFNNDLPEFKAVSAAEARWALAMHRYNQRFLISDPETRAVARYLVGNRFYARLDARLVVIDAKKRGILRRAGDGRICVVGLYTKTGNNLLSVDDRGRQHRTYVDDIGRQAHLVGQRYEDAAEHLPGFCATMLALSRTYHVVDFGDRKGAARYPGLRSQERAAILRLFDGKIHDGPGLIAA